MIQLKSFCFCIPLTTGGVILGIMTFLWTAFAFYVHAVRVKYDQEMDWLFWTSLVVAVLSAITSALLIYGSVTVRETYVSRRIVQKMSLPLSLFPLLFPTQRRKIFLIPYLILDVLDIVVPLLFRAGPNLHGFELDWMLFLKVLIVGE